MLPTKVFEFPANFFCKRIIETILLIFSRHNMKIENYNYVLPIYIVASISRKKIFFIILNCIYFYLGNGLAWMQMDRTGLIKYFLKVNNLPEEINSIQIDNGRKSQRLLRIVHDLEFHGIYLYIFQAFYKLNM